MRNYKIVEGVQYQQPTYLGFLQDAVHALVTSWTDREPNWIEIQISHTHFKPIYILLVVICGLFWTLARIVSSKYILKPLARRAGLEDRIVKKVTELSFNMVVGLVAWIHIAYLTLYKYEIFNNPTKILYDWDINQEADLHQSFVFLYQTGFYIHRTYASWFEDEWRKDSPVLMAHHIFTFMLLSTGYIYRYYYCGIFVLFLHDMNDVLLSASKICNYLTNKEGNNIWAILSRLIFAIFVILWYLFRLHWFPLLLLHTTINLAKIIYNGRYPPMFFFNNTLLMLLLFMHFYWFKFILSAAFKIITNCKGPIKDGRDYEKKSE